MLKDDNESKNDVKNFIDAELFCYKVHFYRVSAERKKKRVIVKYVLNLETDYTEKIKDLIKYFIILQRSKDLSSRQFTQFKKNILKFIV